MKGEKDGKNPDIVFKIISWYNIEYILRSFIQDVILGTVYLFYGRVRK